MKQSGRIIGQQHTEALKEHLESLSALPVRGGKLNATALAKGCGFDRQVLYKNPQCRALIEDRLNKEGLPPLASPTPKKATPTKEQSESPEQIDGVGKNDGNNRTNTSSRELADTKRRLAQALKSNAALEKRLHKAEIQALALNAEKQDLRDRLKRLEHLEHLILSGKRI